MLTLDHWFSKIDEVMVVRGAYGVLGVFILYLLYHFITAWQTDKQKGRLLDLKVREEKTRDVVKKLSDDQLIDELNKPVGKSNE